MCWRPMGRAGFHFKDQLCYALGVGGCQSASNPVFYAVLLRLWFGPATVMRLAIVSFILCQSGGHKPRPTFVVDMWCCAVAKDIHPSTREILKKEKNHRDMEEKEQSPTRDPTFHCHYMMLRGTRGIPVMHALTAPSHEISGGSLSAGRSG